MDAVITWLQTLDGATVLLVLGLSVFLESAALLGLFAPGEMALLAAGAAAAGGRTSLVGVLAVALAGAVVGEAAGYELGRRRGQVLLARAGRHHRLGPHVPAAVDRVQRRGAAVVLVSRWNGMLRALVPLVAGSTRMPYGRFSAANVVGGAVWVTVVAGAGYLAAGSVEQAGTWLLSTSVAAVAVVAGLLLLGRRRAAAGATRVDPSVREQLLGGRSTALWRVAAGLLTGVLVYVLLARFVDLDLGRTLSDLGRWPTLVAITLELAALACLGQVYRSTFAAIGGRIRTWPATRLGLGAFGFSQLLPGGGAVGSLYVARQFTRRHGVDPAGASTATVLFGIVTMGALAGIASLAATTATAFSPGYSRYALFAGAVAAVVLAVLLALRTALNSARVRRRVSTALARILRSHASVAGEWEDTLARQAAYLRDPSRLAAPTAWSALNWLLDMGVLALFGWSTGLGVPLLAIVVAYAVGNLLNGLPLTPGGIGLVETGIVGTLVAFGADAGPASAVAISYRLVAHWLPLLVAGPVLVSELRRGRRQGAVS